MGVAITGKEEVAIAPESLEEKRMELIAIKGTSHQTVASELVVEDLDVAEGEELEDSQPKAWGHLILLTTQNLPLQMAL